MNSKEAFMSKNRLIQGDYDKLLSGNAEMESAIEKYREEINRLRKKRDVLLKMNMMLKEEMKDLYDVFFGDSDR